ncbi:MAG: LysE family translocator [Rhodospirillales bacterium]
MELSHLIAFNLALGVAICSPGPALIYIIQSSLSGGRAVGFLTGCGSATAAAGWTLAALMGLDQLFQLFPWAYAGFKTAGALYLMVIAWRTWRNAHVPIEVRARPHARAYLGGLLVNLANPKAVLFAGAVLVVVFPPGLSLADKALVTANHLGVEIVAYGLFATLLNTRAVSARYLRLKPVFDRVAAAVLGALGVRLILDRS